jgi:hypothetical protein
MTLGALIVLAVLVAAGIYMPRRSKTQAETAPSQPQSNAAESMSTGSQDGGQQTPAAVPTPASPAMSVGAEGANAAQTEYEHQAADSPSNRKLTGKNNLTGPAVPAALQEADNSAPSDNAAATAANLDELEHAVDQLSSRAGAVDASLERLQQQQANAGFGLRGDMAARQVSMKNNLAKAQSAIERGDAQRARKYMDLVQSDVEALEHFLGH